MLREREHGSLRFAPSLQISESTVRSHTGAQHSETRWQHIWRRNRRGPPIAGCARVSMKTNHIDDHVRQYVRRRVADLVQHLLGNRPHADYTSSVLRFRHHEGPVGMALHNRPPHVAVATMSTLCGTAALRRENPAVTHALELQYYWSVETPCLLGALFYSSSSPPYFFANLLLVTSNAFYSHSPILPSAFSPT